MTSDAGRDRTETPLAPSLTQIAEDAGAYMHPGPGDIRAIQDDVVLVHRPSSDSYYGHEASRLRLPADPRARIEEIRGWFRSHGCTKWIWVLGPSSTPSDLEGRLRAGHDLRRAEEGGHRALLLDHEPPPGPAGVEIREVLTYELFCDLDEVQSIAFGETDEQRAGMAASRPVRWDSLRESGDVALLCSLDGRPVAGATMTRLEHGAWFLLGGATIPEARGRGLYRALVHARWTSAIAHGGAALVVHAGPMSAPILERVGFADIGRIDLLLERDQVSPPDRPG